jgi:hypothetical protein
LGVNI